MLEPTRFCKKILRYNNNCKKDQADNFEPLHKVKGFSLVFAGVKPVVYYRSKRADYRHQPRRVQTIEQGCKILGERPENN